MTVDSGSYTNVVSEKMVMKLGLNTEKHPKPCNIHWLQDGGGMKITHRCFFFFFSIGKTYCDELWCDVMKMSACHLLLGRLWMFDPRVQQDGYHNTYSFIKDGYKIVLKPRRREEFAKKPKPEQLELMMRSGIVDYLAKGRPFLFSKAKEKPMEEDDEFELSFVKGLDLRTSLSQVGENDINARTQAQVDQAHFQAQFQSSFVRNSNFHKGPFTSYFGHSGTCFKAKTMSD